MDKVDTTDLKLSKRMQKKNRGRWTKKEQQIFLKGLHTQGKNWKKIQQLLPSRSLSQIRSHAQKYFIRVKNQKYNSEDQYSDQNSSDAEVQYIPPYFKLKQQINEQNTLQYSSKDILHQQKHLEIRDQDNFSIKIQQNDSNFQPISEDSNLSLLNPQIIGSLPLPNDWYSSGPSVFHQIMLYYHNQIYNSGNWFPCIDYTGYRYGCNPN